MVHRYHSLDRKQSHKKQERELLITLIHHHLYIVSINANYISITPNIGENTLQFINKDTLHNLEQIDTYLTELHNTYTIT